jgi:hypothetical protein
MRVAPGFGHVSRTKWKFFPEKTATTYGIHLWREEKPKTIFLCEGEFDCILLNQHGLHALTSTTGVASSEHCIRQIPQDTAEEIILAFDNDEAGHKATAKLAIKLKADYQNLRIKRIAWPTGFEKDVTDFALLCKKKNQQFGGSLLALAIDIDDEFLRANQPPSSNPPEPGTQTPMEFRNVASFPPTDLEGALEKARKIGCIHDHILEVILATYISKEIEKKNPIWLLLVGNPSSLKTELASLLRWAPETYMLDVMTSNPFISGLSKKEKPQDLLPLLDKQCFIVKDYTSFFGRSEETVKQLLSDLVSIYDGEFSKHSGARGTVRHQSLFSHIGCITPEGLKMRQRYMNMVGARFLTLRVPELTDEQKEQCFKIAWAEDLKERSVDAAKAAISLVQSISNSIRKSGIHLAPIEESLRSELNLLAQLTARARGIVHSSAASFRDESGKEIIYNEVSDPQIEEPFRALHQFRTLARSLAILRGKEAVTMQEVKTVHIVALSSMPVHRAEVLAVFKNRERLSAKEASDFLNRPPKTVRRHFDELYHLGLLHREKAEFEEEEEGEEEKKKPWIYFPHPKFARLIFSENDNVL